MSGSFRSIRCQAETDLRRMTAELDRLAADLARVTAERDATQRALDAILSGAIGGARRPQVRAQGLVAKPEPREAQS